MAGGVMEALETEIRRIGEDVHAALPTPVVPACQPVDDVRHGLVVEIA